MITLTTDRLRVEIFEPGEWTNSGSRFDRAGFISEVVLDGNIHFCANEPKNLVHPCTGGRGLCCEYKADYSGEAEEGTYYPKFGVGLLKKRGTYCFYEQYEVVPFDVQVEQNAAEVIFYTKAKECLGYAAETVKKVSVNGNILTVEVTMKNTGKREIVTEEYCHNFLSIDGMAISPEYRLELPDFGLNSQELRNNRPYPCNYLADDTGISFKQPQIPVSVSNLSMDGYRGVRPFHWELYHSGAGAADRNG